MCNFAVLKKYSLLNQFYYPTHMQKTLLSPALCGLALFGGLLTSCVQDEYDLSEDIDLTVSVGGNITLPSSSTDAMNMGQILDLDESSSIKTVEAKGQYGLEEGDYVLVQGGDPTTSLFNVPLIDISNLKGSRVETDLPDFVNPGSHTGTVFVSVPTQKNSVELSDDNVTPTVVAIKGADVDMTMNYQFSYISDRFSGNATIERGFELNFDPSWTCVIADQATASILEMTDAHTARFKSNVTFSKTSPLRVAIKVNHIEMPAGQGLVSKGHFRLNSEISGDGRVGLKASEVPAGGVKIKLVTTCNVNNVEIEAVTGKFDPEINVNSSTFTINDVPDFLKSEDNNLDVDNPRISIKAVNTSAVPVEIDARIVAVRNGNRIATVGIGSSFGTKSVVIAPGESEIVISRRGLQETGFTNIVVPDLGKLITTVPDEITLTDVNAHAVQNVVTMTLGKEYRFDASYEAIVPLSFGRDMLIHYTDENVDLGDLADYNFKEAEISLSAVNTIPLELHPTVEAIDVDGNVITDITATVEGDVKPGKVDAPVSSPVKIRLKSTAQNMGHIYGIRYAFDARSGEMVSVTLNEKQAIRFTDIKVRLIGGVQINLND